VGPGVFDPVHLAWSADRRYLAAAFSGGVLRAYDAATGRGAHTMELAYPVDLVAGGA
jgi:hypothetical protein